MTFPEYWQTTYQGGIPEAALPAAEALARSAWDAALCAAQEASFKRGEMRPAGEICAALSTLHTWNQSLPTDH